MAKTTFPGVGNQSRRNLLRVWPQAVLTILLIVLGLLVSFPFIWMVRSSVMLEKEALVFPPIWIPSEFTLASYIGALTIQPFARYILNSLFVSTTIMLGQVLTASMGAYAFARLRFPGRDKLFLAYLATMMIPSQVTLVPSFVLVSWLGWIDTYFAFIVPGLFSAYLTFLMRQFLLNIPKELEDAARIDGASYIRTFATIILPLAQSALVTCGLLSFMGSWTSFLWPLIVTRSSDMRTVPIGLAALQQQQGYVNFPQLMAGSVMALLPIIILFLSLQRYYLQGIATTGLKG
jgi:multiple sugar transport system permease protein